MSLLPEDVQTLRSICAGAKLVTEGPLGYIYLPNLAILVGEQRVERDALLCPHKQSGYETRLFLSAPISEIQIIRGKAANWSAHQIMGRTWHSWSWQGVSATLPLPQMLLAHLSAFR